MVPQRDRAFSWDIMFENGLHSDISGNITMNGIPQDHLLHFPGDSIDTNEDSKKLIIRAKFPSKPLHPKVKEESTHSKSCKDSQVKEIDRMLETEIATEDIIEDPLLLSIPNDLLLDNGDLLGFEERQRAASFDKSHSLRSTIRDGRQVDHRGDNLPMSNSIHRSYSESAKGLHDVSLSSSSTFHQQKSYFPSSNLSQNSGYLHSLTGMPSFPFSLKFT